MINFIKYIEKDTGRENVRRSGAGQGGLCQTSTRVWC